MAATSVSGFCAECGRFLEIKARGWWPGKLNQKWYPVSHPARGDDTGGKECEGVKVAL